MYVDGQEDGGMTQVKLNQKAEQYLGEPYARLLIPNPEGGYTAEILEFPGCITQGRTADEAVNNLNEAAKSWVEASLEDGREIPSPASNYDHSGKVALRMPRSLHRHAAQMAERNSTSLNQYVVAAVAEQVGASELYNRLVEKIEESIQRSFACAVTLQNTYVAKNMNFVLASTGDSVAQGTDLTYTVTIPVKQNQPITLSGEGS